MQMSGFLGRVSRSPPVDGIEMATAKTHYKVSHKIEAFYSGGAVSLARSGDLIACAYFDEVKVMIVHHESQSQPLLILTIL